jgi:hypothetical protein
MGALRNPSAPIPHDSLRSSPFYFKGPRTAATEKPPETKGHPFFGDSWGIRVVLTMLEGEDIMDNDDKEVFNQNK